MSQFTRANKKEWCKSQSTLHNVVPLIALYGLQKGGEGILFGMTAFPPVLEACNSFWGLFEKAQKNTGC